MDRQNEDFKQKRNGDERDRMNNNWDRTGDRERCFPQLPERRGSGESRSCST